MPRKARVAPGGLVYHVLNRAAGRMKLFRTEKDYAAFERVMLETAERAPLRLLAWCLMPNHWHFVVWPRDDGEVTDFFRRLAHTHAMRWRVSHHTVGHGPVYQGRFKSFPIQRGEHLRTACRYVERNALTAGLVKRAQDWRWGSLRAHDLGGEPAQRLLATWPTPRPTNWVERVNEPITRRELCRLELSERRGRPYGDDPWTLKTAGTLGLGHTLRNEGRPRKEAENAKN